MNNMKNFFKNRETAAAFVNDILLNSNSGSPWTMIIAQVPSGDYYVSGAISSLWEGTVETPFKPSTITSQRNTQDG